MARFCVLVCLCLIAAHISSAAPVAEPSAAHPAVNGENFDIADDDGADLDNQLVAYVPVINKRNDFSGARDNKIKTYKELERELTLAGASGPKRETAIVQAASADAERSGSPNGDAIKSIAFNSREVRIVGPDAREVEMKDDIQTKVAVALDNLQKEAAEAWEQVNEKLDKGWTELKRHEVWGQVNEKLDKGWTDFKSMVEGVVAPAVKQVRKQN